jgi:hemoglobin
MNTSHRGMGINESDWQRFIGHLEATLDKFEVPAPERAAVMEFVDSTKAEIVG